MGFQRFHVAKGHWRDVNTVELVPLIRVGVRFEDGVVIALEKKRTKALA
jgi:hypothetical protein